MTGATRVRAVRPNKATKLTSALPERAVCTLRLRALGQGAPEAPWRSQRIAGVLRAERRMRAYRRSLLDHLHRQGWEVAAIETQTDWWADELWQVRSIRDQWGLVLWLSFLVDPQYEGVKKVSAVWKVSATTDRPRDRLEAERGIAVADLAKGTGPDKMGTLVAQMSAFRDLGGGEQADAPDEGRPGHDNHGLRR